MSDERCDTPWDTLRRLVDTASTGELLIASDAVEIHVYLLDGRLAWATSSTAHNEFLRRLVEHHGISSDVLRDAIEDGRRTRGRLGETLIAWGVASAAQIRDALRGQIEEALVTAIAHPGARCLFLPHRLPYAAELTFELAGLAVDAAAAGRRSDIAHRVVSAVLEGVPDALWVEVVERGEVVAHAVRETARAVAVVDGLQRALADRAIDALTLRRTVHGSVLGRRLPGLPAVVWCAVGSSAPLGVTSAVLASAVGALHQAPDGDGADEPWHETVDPAARFGASMIAGATRGRDELVAGFALGLRGGPTGVWRGSPGIDVHVGWAHRLAPLLAAATRDAASRSIGALIYDRVALRAVIGRVAYYGALLPDSATAVWLVLRTWASQGLGWALLQTVARQVGGDS
ncbi:MAG TPA: DUF4388 domain-containing protein [Kofleriaceae bacterium]|nr:DUF4388 domain-containing protein [Kofleriaceae bacterium]